MNFHARRWAWLVMTPVMATAALSLVSCALADEAGGSAAASGSAAAAPSQAALPNVSQATSAEVAQSPAVSARQLARWQDDLAGESLLKRRAAVRGLSRAGDAARPALRLAAANDDLQTRRLAVAALGRWGDGDTLIVLKRALQDDAWLVRLAAVEALARQSPRSADISAALKQAADDPQQDVWQAASAALWPYSAKPQAVRDRKDLDFDLRTVAAIALPVSGWRFKTDLEQTGHTQDWFNPAMDDSGWSPIEIDSVWNNRGFGSYSGVAWYRLTFDLPDKPRHDGVDLVFDAVDNAAWVWVNGQFIAGHDIGRDGWNATFRMEVTAALKWGQPNQITVRVRGGDYAGGIYKPVHLDVLSR